MSKMTMAEAGRLGGLKCKDFHVNRYHKNPKKCKSCNTELSYEKRRNKFCNHSCAASFNNKKQGRRESNVPEIQICKSCGSNIEHSRHVQKYCSQDCSRFHQWELRKAKVESGQENSEYVLKKYLIETRGVQCEICCRKTWQGGPIPVIMDHIDGNSDNNLLVNLRLVCGNCDMQLPTFAGRNRGSGRHYRRQRYSEGKSS